MPWLKIKILAYFWKLFVTLLVNMIPLPPPKRKEKTPLKNENCLPKNVEYGLYPT